MRRRAYPSDIDDETYAFLLPYLALSPEDAPQRRYPLREVLNALLWLSRTGAQWAYLPHEFPPPEIVRSQAKRWFQAQCFENAVHDLRLFCRVKQKKHGEPTAIIVDSRTLQSTPESGHRAGFDGAKKRKGTKVHLAIDTLGHLVALMTSPANEQDRAQVEALCHVAQLETGGMLEVAFVDQGYTGEAAQSAARNSNMELIVVKRPDASRSFVLLPKRWVVERSFAWLARFRRLARDLERLSATLIGFHFLAACVLLLAKWRSFLAAPLT
ncbi:IS5 family transposase [Deinococcus sp. HMF7604]|uniref:IS5 family transposase n=1 Tax=Deinococcus betulae TaxID=2873312 RepID=UPI001CD03B2B|nr:IS5 family transposase [Deinococcus betulae]MBZ9753645.1 IS5 family transposase [Deinococcus betulae]